MYETDLTEAQWQVIKNHLPNINRKRKNSLREILNAILYLNKTGCQWRYLPKSYPKWQLVFYYFNLWQIEEIWDDLMIRLTEMAREKLKRNSQASVVIVDCQSVKTTMVGGLRGYDGNKKVKGRKRHIAVDTQGNLIDTIVHCANQHETKTLELLVQKLKEHQFRIVKIIADAGYRGEIIETIKNKYNIILEVIPRDKVKEAFAVQAKRWIVERTISWFDGSRRLCRDFERLLENSRAMLLVFAIRLSLNKF
jgi:putative transposase